MLCSVAGLRGSVSLILAQAVVIEVPHANDPTVLVQLYSFRYHPCVWLSLINLAQAVVPSNYLLWRAYVIVLLLHVICLLGDMLALCCAVLCCSC